MVNAEEGPAPLLPSSPDLTVEDVTCYPSDTELAYSYRVVMTPPKAGVEDAKCAPDKAELLGAMAADWENVKKHASKALAMSASTAETIGDRPRNRMTHTLLVPRAGLAGAAAVGDPNRMEEFAPGGASTLAALTAVCGPPESTETWDPAVALACRISGNTYWWGCTGVAVDATDNITHLMLRHYPGPDPALEAGYEAAPRPASGTATEAAPEGAPEGPPPAAPGGEAAPDTAK